MSGLEIFMVVFGALAFLVVVFFVIGMRNKRKQVEAWQTEGSPDKKAVEEMDAQLDPYQDVGPGPQMSLSERWEQDSGKERAQ